jgi:hypothetical protein
MNLLKAFHLSNTLYKLINHFNKAIHIHVDNRFKNFLYKLYFLSLTILSHIFYHFYIAPNKLINYLQFYNILIHVLNDLQINLYNNFHQTKNINLFHLVYFF